MAKKQNKKAKKEITEDKLAEKIDESSNAVEIENLQEEIRNETERCVKCGLCKGMCPVFKIMKEEYYSPRGKAILLSEDIIDKIVFQCNLCKSCEENCPLGLHIADSVAKAREILVLKGKGLEENKEMIKNIRETGNPFGKNPDEKGKLYCC